MSRLIVTGAGSGLGTAAARLALERGWEVAGVDRRVERVPAGAIRAEVDVTDPTAVSEAVAAIAATWGAEPDAAILCAGINDVVASNEADADRFAAILDVNVRGSFLVAQALARRWAERSHPGSIVALSSVGGMRGDTVEPAAAYSASKAAVVGLVAQLAVEWGPAGIRVNAVAPGVIDAGMMTLDQRPDELASFLAGLPLGRLGRADEVAEACLFLAGAQATYITGAVLAVDGGYLVR